MDGDPKPARFRAGSSGEPWWRGATVYQVYPRSYLDTNNDGIGDLPGITRKLDYIASLGADVVWISPFFTSPMKDFGYDVADYCNVDPIFGTLEDFDALIARAEDLGLRIIVDQVYSHTSDQHAWFSDSRQGRSGRHADWYVWRDPKPDGAPPNNWQSVFGGPAWTWDARRQQYYMHNFLSSQPQLNVHNPEVQEALLAVARFWLDRGVSGFRLDAINFAMFDPEFRDNPARPTEGRRITRPFDMQYHVHNQSHPDIPRFLERVRALTDEYGCVFTLAEIGGPDALGEMRRFTEGDRRLNSAYSFDFLYAPKLHPATVRRALENWAAPYDEGWPSWAFSNHDAPRCVSRWAAPEDRVRMASLTNALLLSLRGNPILYQGEELGLPQAEIAFEDLKDPEAVANWPLTLGRDGARTPMPWERGAPHAGFSEARPWLPVNREHEKLSVSEQENDPGSVLHFTRRLIAARSQLAVLRKGTIQFLDLPDPLLGFERSLQGESLICLFNLSAQTCAIPSVVGPLGDAVVTSGCSDASVRELPGYAVWIGRLSTQ